MNILIAGGTGLIGSALANTLGAQHAISILTRDTNKAPKYLAQCKKIEWKSDELKPHIEKTDLVINLVGQSIGDKRWSDKTKRAIVDSRITPAKQLCDIIESLPANKRPRLFNASAIGVYGIQPTLSQQNNIIYTEEKTLPTPPQDFLAVVGAQWESVIDAYPDIDCVTLRFGVVLSPQGGMLKKLLLPFKFCLGGKIGTGQQPLSWIAIEDLIGIIDYLIQTPDIKGPINVVAPEVISQHSFAKTFAKRLHRPAFMPMPSFVVKLLFGQMGQELLLSGQQVRSIKLDDYNFKFPTLKSALDNWQL